jgi:hypothetical protein
MTPYAQGHQDALYRMGLCKTAATIHPGVVSRTPLLKGVKGWVQKKLPNFKKSVRDLAIGDPRRVASEFQEGGFKRLFAKGDPSRRAAPGIFRESMITKDPISIGLFYGLPAVEAGQIAMDDEANKGRRIGETAGSALLGAATWKPLGMLGMMATDPIGRTLGGSIGSLGDVAAKGISRNKPATEEQIVNPNYGG